MNKEKILFWLNKIGRISGALLFLIMMLFAISGYGMTRGLIDPVLAQSLHFKWLMWLGVFFLIIHSYWGFELEMKINKVWSKTGRIFLILFFVLIFAGFIFMEFFYTPSADGNNQATNNSYNQVTQVAGNINTNSNSVAGQLQKTFNAQELSRYNGLNGQPAYVAVNGVVYDVSKVFRNGQHGGYSAGQDLTNAFYSKHGADKLRGLLIVGKYQP